MNLFKKIKWHCLFNKFRKPVLVTLTLGFFLLIYMDTDMRTILPSIKEELWPAMQIPTSVKHGKFASNPKEQWLDNGDYFVLTAQQTTLYKQANITQPIKEKLPILKRVKIALNDTPNTIDETWVFICDLHHKPLGWVRTDDLSFKHAYGPVSDWDYGDFELSQNHKRLSFKTHRKGYFNIKWTANVAGVRMKGKQKGRFYDDRYIIWAKAWHPYPNNYFFYIDKQDELNPEIHFPDTKLKLKNS